MVRGFESDAWDESLNPQLRASQVIVAALAFGALSFLVITVFMSPMFSGEAAAPPAQQEAGPRQPLILYIALALTCVALAARFVIPGMVDVAGRRSLEVDSTVHHGGPADRSDLDGKLMALYQRRLIVAAALIEVPTFMMIMAYMIEHQHLALGCSVLLIAFIGAHFPTQQRVSKWLAHQRRLIHQQGAFGPH